MLHILVLKIMKFNKLHIVIFIIVATMLGACSEYEDTVVPSPTVSADNPAVRFYSENPTLFELTPEDLSFSLTVVRDNGTAAIEVPVAVIGDTANIFTVPATVSFPAGEDTTSLIVTVAPTAPQGEVLDLEVAVDEEYSNPYKAEYPWLKTTVFIEPPCAYNKVTLDFIFDDYASECTWELLNSNGEVIESGGPWEDGTPSASTDLCLEDGMYTFTVYDGYGDGLSTGNISIIYNGEEIVSIAGSDYEESKSVTFSLGN